MLDLFYGWSLPKFTPPFNEHSGKWLTDMLCMELFNRWTNIALSRFKWRNLPATCNERALEETLFFYGKAVFFFDPDLGLAHTPVNLTGPFNIYFESVKRHAFSFNDFERDLTIDDSVLVKNNMTMTPDYLVVWNYVPKIVNCMRAIEIHTETLKRPFLIHCQEKEKTSVARAIKNVTDNEVAIVGSKILDPDSLNVLNLGDKCYLPEFWANVKNWTAQGMTALGIRNAFTEKRERLVTTEAEGEETIIRHALQSGLESRQAAAKEINAKWGTNIQVEANELEIFVEEELERNGELIGLEGGAGNGNV